MRIAMIGCGYVANMYRLTLPLHPGLELVGVCDRDPARARGMAELSGATAYDSLDELLASDTQLVLNLTNPGAHYEITKQCLEAGKHVYTEKPVAMELAQADELVELAKGRGLHLSSAPCTLMSESAQTLWQCVRDKRVGDIRLVYAEMEDGMVHRMPVQRWVNEAGVPWPYRDEFETGCTIEHAGYVLSWLAGIFGPAVSLSASADTLIPDKLGDDPIECAADFSVGCVRFASGVVARLTCGVYAPHDHRLRVFGDEGVITVHDPRSDDSRVTVQRYMTFRRGRKLIPWGRKVRLVGPKKKHARYRGSQKRDFCRGIADMAQAIESGSGVYLDADFSRHINEMVLAIHGAMGPVASYKMTTTFTPLRPLPWAGG